MLNKASGSKILCLGLNSDLATLYAARTFFLDMLEEEANMEVEVEVKIEVELMVGVEGGWIFLRGESWLIGYYGSEFKE